jgi:CubicO group peptidase (beta-lactamase class C family)
MRRERLPMRHEASWDRTSDEVSADLERARARGLRVVSLTSYGDPGEVRHAIVLAPNERALAQRFEADVALGLEAGVLARHARDGFHPVLVGMTGPSDRPVLAFVLERVEGGAIPPRFVPPRPFRDADGALFVTRAPGEGPRDAGHLLHLAAAGAPRDATGAGLHVAGIWAPQPSTRIAWAVHLDAVGEGAWRDRREPRTLEAVARPVCALPIVSPSGARWVLSLWHDRVIEPWPAGDPFADARRFEADEADSAEALDRAVRARQVNEDRRVIAIGAHATPGSTRFLALYGSPGNEAPLARRFVAVAPGELAPPAIPASADARLDHELAPDHPLDRWALDHMRATGARHGQLVVVRGRRLAFARAYTYAEAGYPVASLDDAMRLGSVSKALTAVALFAALARRGFSVDARLVDLLGFAPREGPPRLARVTLRHLLAHDAGLRTFTAVRPDEPRNALSEHAVTTLLQGAPGPARSGMLSRALRAIHDDSPFARDPGAASRPDYSNEGFILLGELVAHLTRGSADAYEAALADLVFRPAGVDPRERGVIFGAGRAHARERRESPAHPTSPTWAEDRFAPRDGASITLAPYADNGPFLGGAAGVAIPLLWLARVLAALGPRADGSGLLRRSDADLASSPLGFHLGEPGFWTFRQPGGAPLTTRVNRLCHNGRLDGGAALVIHQIPESARDDALDATLSVAVAFNQLGSLYEDPHGRRLFAILRRLEGEPFATGWHSRDLFVSP